MNASRKFLLFSVASWCSLVIAPPLAAGVGMQDLASVMYRFFSHVCHQYDSHSFHLLGMKLGVCIRCSSIYFGFLGGVLAAGMLPDAHRRRFTAPFLVAMLPMVLDVTLDVLGIHSSNDVTRAVSGLVFGSASGVLLTPYLVEGFAQCFELVKGIRHAKT